jgi:DNA mismatch repair ATPase MutS
MNYHLSLSKELTKYSKFNDALSSKIVVLSKFKGEIENITPFKVSVPKFMQIGHIMWSFYQLYNNDEYHDAMLYSFGFNGYMNLLQGIKENVDTNKMTSVTLIKGQTKPVLKQMYYPKFIDEAKIVKNNCDLSKNMVITGPNASGKTTTLKTALINIILSQHIGFGCYDKCKLEPFDNIHCYLNIPDTSGRDSLFQAEARRCKEIIDCIEEGEKDDERHFAIFDELYSGTNPEEAVVSAQAFMDFIVKNDNVTCMLTTHYVKLCKKLAKNKKIENFNMKTVKKNDNFSYTYELEKGISKVKGGHKVLSDMAYPKEILEQTSGHYLN